MKKQLISILTLVMGEKAVWDNATLKHFIGICKEEL
jgi:hypothetical protein